MLLATACQAPPEPRHATAGASAEAGRRIVERVGCAACHVFPDIDWPRGAVGPDLGGFARRSMIAGRIPNRPNMLADFVRDAPSLVPGTTMPAMPIEEREARDVAAYLYTLDGD